MNNEIKALQNAAFYGVIMGMLDDLPAQKRRVWISQLAKIQKAKLIPEFNFV